MENIDKNEIVKKITSEVLVEVKKSPTKITSEELKNKIQSKINDFFNKKRDNDKKEEKRQFAEDEKFIEEEFRKNCLEDEDEEVDETKEKVFNNFENQQNTIKEEQMLEIIEKKPFFREVSDLYKEEYQKSIKGFGNFINSFQFIKKASIIEKFLTLLFIMLSALISGMMGIALLLVLFFIWQISIIIKVLLELFKRCEKTLIIFSKNIKKRINFNKTSGGFFKRLLFSNLLYSVLLINGILYLCIKGFIIPIDSINKINKLIGNFIAKTTRTISNIFKSPSDLLLSNIKNNALTSGKGTNFEKGISINNGKVFGGSMSYKRKLIQRRRQKRNKADKNRDIQKDVERIFEKGQETQSNDKKPQEENTRNEINNINSKEQENIETRIEKLGLNSDMQNIPASLNLSNMAMESYLMTEIGNLVFNDVIDRVSDMLILQDENKNISTNINKINNDLKEETKEKINNIKNAENNLSNLGYENPITLSSQYKELRDNGIEYPAREILKSQNKNWDSLTQDEKIKAGINVGDIRTGQEDLRDLKHYNEWAKKDGENIEYEFYLSTKLQNAEKDFKQEAQEFKDRYGQDCQQLLEKEMIKQGIPITKSMNDKEFESVVMNIVKKFPEEQQVDMAKDFREHSLTYLELQNCKKDLKQERENNKVNENSVVNNGNLFKKENPLNQEIQETISQSLKSFTETIKEKRATQNIIQNMKNIENSNNENTKSSQINSSKTNSGNSKGNGGISI